MGKLSDKEISELCRKYKNGGKVLDLLKEYNVSRATFYKYVKSDTTRPKPVEKKSIINDVESESDSES